VQGPAQSWPTPYIHICIPHSMQSQFLNKVILHKMMWEVYFITSLNIISVALDIIWTFTNFGKGFTPNQSKSVSGWVGE
jgi:hypothetical protein